MESLMEMLDSIRPEARAIHLLTSEYTLYRLRHPDSPQMAAGREELIARFSEIIEKVLARMGRRPAVSTTSLADVICLLYLDSVVNQPARSAGSAAAPPAQVPPSDASTSTYEVIEAVLLGLSEPVEAPPGVGSPA